jgi:multiple sugar transport system permease protein
MATATTAPPTTATADTIPANPHHRHWSNIGTVAVMVIIVIWCLAPFYWMTVLAFRDPTYTFSTDLWFSHVTLDNFKYAFNTDYNHFGRSLVNSLIIGTAVTLLSMVIGVFAGYAWPVWCSAARASCSPRSWARPCSPASPS